MFGPRGKHAKKICIRILDQPCEFNGVLRSLLLQCIIEGAGHTVIIRLLLSCLLN